MGEQGCSRPGQHKIALNAWASFPLPPGLYGMLVNSDLRLLEGSKIRNYPAISPTQSVTCVDTQIAKRPFGFLWLLGVPQASFSLW